MTILALRRARALAAVSVFALSGAVLVGCNSEGDLALQPKEVRTGSQDAAGTQMASGEHGAHGAPAAAAPEVKMPLFNDLGSHTHQISTKNRDAQAYFDQGYRLL